MEKLEQVRRQIVVVFFAAVFLLGMFLAKDYEPAFTFNEGVEAVGLPVPQKSDGFHYNIYRIAVNGLDVGPIYQISYRKQKPRTFKFYGGREQVDKYRDRYGSYF